MSRGGSIARTASPALLAAGSNCGSGADEPASLLRWGLFERNLAFLLEDQSRFTVQHGDSSLIAIRVVDRDVSTSTGIDEKEGFLGLLAVETQKDVSR